jgi:hypothetical protein
MVAPLSLCVYGRSLPECRPGNVNFGQFCDASGGEAGPQGGNSIIVNGVHPCGTTIHQNNCFGGYDIYVHVHCLVPPQTPPPPPPPPSAPTTHNVELSVTCAGTPDDFPASVTDSIADRVASTAGVSRTQVSIRVALASVRISITIATSSESEATTISSAVTTQLGTVAAATAFLAPVVPGITVASVVQPGVVQPGVAPTALDQGASSGSSIGIIIALAIPLLILVPGVYFVTWKWRRARAQRLANQKRAAANREAILEHDALVSHAVNSLPLAKYQIPAIEMQTLSGEAPPTTTTRAGADKDCAICLTPFIDGEEIRRLPCEHIFKKKCIDEWMLNRGRVASSDTSKARSLPVCPLCKKPAVDLAFPETIAPPGARTTARPWSPAGTPGRAVV